MNLKIIFSHFLVKGALALATLGAVGLLTFHYFHKPQNERKIASSSKLVLPAQEVIKEKRAQVNKASKKVIQSTSQPRGIHQESGNESLGEGHWSSSQPLSPSYQQASSTDFSLASNPVVLDQQTVEEKESIPSKTNKDSTFSAVITRKTDEGGNNQASGNKDTLSTDKNIASPIPADVRANISGKVLPLVEVAALSAYAPLRKLIPFAEAIAADALSCTNPAIQLFDLKTMSPLADNPISMDPITGDVSFVFDPYELNLEIDRPTRYLLKTTGCNVTFKRLITSFYSPQDIDYLSTFVSEIIKSDTAIIVDEIDPMKIEYLEKLIEKNLPQATQDLPSILDHIANDPSLSDKFEEVTGSPVATVSDAAPQMNFVTVENQLREGVLASFEASAVHWSPSYTIAYQWALNGVTVSNSALWQYTADPNTLTDAHIELWVGQKQAAANDVDLAKPYYYFDWHYQVEDSYPVSLPIITLSSNQISSSHDAVFTLDPSTIAYADGTTACDTLSAIAIVEEGVTPQIEDFTYHCTDTTINYTVQKASDGDVDIDFYAIDINGAISAKNTISLHIDTTAPTITFTDIASYYRADRTHRFEWTLDEVNSSAAQFFTLSFSPDGVSWSDLAPVALTDGPHQGTSFYSDIYLPNIASSTAALKITYADLLGNSTTVSQQIEIRSPNLTVSANFYDFGNIFNLSTTPSHSFVLGNNGTADAEGCAVEITGTDAVDFSIVSNDCGATLSVGDSCEVLVNSEPKTKGAKSAQLKMTCGSDIIQSSLLANSMNNPPVAPAALGVAISDNHSFAIALNPGSDVDNPVGDLVYKITQAPAVGTLSNCITTASYGQDLSCDYIAPVNYDGVVTFKYIINDGTDDATSETTVTITVSDLTPTQPVLIPQNFVANALTESTPLTLTATSCVDISKIMIKESIIAPLAADSGWQNCSTTSGSLTFDPSITNVQGSRTLYIFGIDPKNNISTAQQINYRYDTVAPQLAFSNIQSFYRADRDYTFEWTLTEANSAAGQFFNLRFSPDGISWVNLPDVVLTAGPHNGTTFSTVYHLPNISSVNSKLELHYADEFGRNTTIVQPLEIRAPALSYNPLSHDFGSILNLSTNHTFTFDVSNTGQVAAETCSFALSGADKNEYSIVSSNCGATIAAAATCQVQIRVSPLSKAIKNAAIDLSCGSDFISAGLSALSINNPPVTAANQSQTIRDNQSVAITLSAGTDIDNPVGDLRYKLTQLPTAGTLSNCLTTSSYLQDLTCDYIAPLNYHGTVTFKYLVNDGTDDSASETTVTLTVQDQTSTQPLLIPVNFAANALTDSTPLTLTATNCTDIAKIMIKESSATPAAGDAGWQTCTAAVGGHTFDPSITNAQGSRTLYIFGIDPVGNISTSQVINYRYDTLVPVIAFKNIQSSYRADRTHTFEWTLVETNSNDAQFFHLRFSPDGTNWQTLPDVALTNGPHDGTTFSTDFLLPNISSSASKIEVSYTDEFGRSVTKEQGIVIRAPLLSFTPASHNFGDILNLSTNHTVSFTINNAGLVAAETCALSLSGLDKTEYSISSTTCAATLAAGGSCQAVVRVSPLSKASKIASLDLACGSDHISAALSAQSINNPPVAPSNMSLSTRDNLATAIDLNSGSDVDNATGDLVYKITQAPAVGTLSNCITTATYGQDLSCTYTAPLNYDGIVTFKYIISDGTNDAASETTVTITVQDLTSTVPSLTPFNFSSGASTSQGILQLTAATCSDISYVLIKENTTTPILLDPEWQPCSTAAGAMTFDPTEMNTQGYRTMRIFGKDSHGNISAYQSIDFIYDSMAPIIVIEPLPTLPYGIDYSIKFRLTEATISAAANFTLQASYNGGTSWSALGSVSVATDGPHSERLYTFTYTVPSGTPYNNALIRISVTDANGLVGTATSNTFRVVEDLGAPYVHPATFKINGSFTPPATAVKYVNVEFKAEDIDTLLTHFCLKGNDIVAPTLEDGCWQAFDAPQPGLTLDRIMQVTDYKFLLGFAPSNFKVSIWVRDLAGNISNNADTTAGKDFVIMNYAPDTPPELTNFFITNSNAPNNPVEDSDLNFNTGDTVYINWRAIDNRAIPASSVFLAYSTDDVNFVAIAPSADMMVGALNNDKNNCPNLNEASNPLDDSATGCYRWTFPLESGQYFRLKIVVSDDLEQDTSMTSIALNSNKFKILAGNVDPGTGASAKVAQFFSKAEISPFTLAVSRDGKIFYKDAKRGLLYINPFTNVLEQLLPETGVSSGDGGPVSNATASYIYKINMDYQDRLLVYESQRIRRINTSTIPMTIETIIGFKENGERGTNRSDIVLDPLDFKLENPDMVQLFQPLPNGDIWFADISGSVPGGNLIRIYKGSLSSPRIESIRISGIGASAPPTTVSSGLSDATADLTKERIVSYQIAFDKETSAVSMIYAKYFRAPYGCSYLMRELINPSTYQTVGSTVPVHRTTCVDSYEKTANDGNHYMWGYHVAHASGINRYNPTTNAYEARFLGNGVHGTCVDGTLATACPIRLTDFFVAVDGTFFFAEAGTIRVIDREGKVQTLYGQSKTYGDGGLGQDARFGSISYIDHGVGENVVMVDSSERVMREIRPNETVAQMARLAGNGVLALGSFDKAVSPAAQMLDSASWGQTYSFATNPSNGDVYYACTWGEVCRLNRSTGLWESFTGGGASSWVDSATLDGHAMSNGGYPVGVNGFFNGFILTGHYSWSGSAHNNSSFRLNDIANSQSYYVAGKLEDVGASGCPSGVGTNCNVASVRQNWAAATWDADVGKILFEFEADRGVKNFRYLWGNEIVTAFAYPEYFASTVKIGNIIYGCTEAGYLKKWDRGTSLVTTLSIPGTARCHGARILYKPASGAKPARLVFPFNQNGLQGIAEYFLN